MIYVFVYGTLKPGERNYWICADRVVKSSPATVQGRLYHLPLGYPVLTPGGDPVKGCLLYFRDVTILQILDDYEQHDPTDMEQLYPDLAIEEHQYTRQQLEVYDSQGQPLGLAWTYTMTPEQVSRLRGKYLATGEWSAT